MYANCNIINPKNRHLFTFIMLHPMQCDSNYFNDFLEYFERIHKAKYLYDSIKFIFPESPIMDIDYPKNKQYNVKSWYNYYTQYDGLFKIDKISISQFNKQSKRIIKIINNEKKLISHKNIYLIGVSQGATLIFNILKYLNFSIGSAFIIDSIYMHKYINLTKSLSPIFIISHYLDEIYPYEFQKYCLKYLSNNNINFKFLTINSGYHASESNKQFIYILNNIFIK